MSTLKETVAAKQRRETLLNEFEKQSRLYHNLGVQERQIKRARGKISEWCKKVLVKLGMDSYDFKGFKATRYAQESVDWNVRALTKLGQEHDVMLVQIVADERAIKEAIESDKISVEELRQCGEVENSWRFRVSPVDEGDGE